MRRCGANIDKRIRNLHESIRELYDDFTSALEEYEPGADVMAEFPSAGLLLGEYGDVVPSFVSVWGYFIEEIIDLTAQGLNAGDVYSSRKKCAQIFLLADALRFSRFLKTLVEDCNILNSYRTGRAKKLKRRLDKVCQYVTGIRHLIQKAKRLFPIPHRWVMDKFTGTGEGVIDLADNPYDAISCGLVCPSLSSKIGNELDNRFTSMLSNWQRQQTMHTCIHAEIRVILHLGLPSANERPLVHAIGVSKRTCFCCTFWIESHNRIFRTKWMTSASHGKPYANWALPGAACSYDGTSSVDKTMLNAVSTQLTGALDHLLSEQGLQW